MTTKTIRAIGAALLVAVWLGLTAFAWLKPAGEESEAERRKLEQFPELNSETLLDASFMSDFESYTLDQFPLRDTFRQLKALFHYNVMRQGDNNDIYIADGYAAKMEYPMSESSLKLAVSKFNKLYDNYLKENGSKVYMAVVPDKGYYLAEDNGYLSMDYDALFSYFRENMDYATHVDLTDCLRIEDYYKTDTHWRQEKLLPAAQKLSEAMGVTAPKAEDFTQKLIERPFYGVYYGQAALPMEPEALYIMESELLSECTVFNYEKNVESKVYDMEKLDSRDLYDVFLSGACSLLKIENPNASTDRELVVFRDSFGSSMIPLLVRDYKTVTVVDIRYIASDLVGNFVEFNGQDVLFLYSTLVLNASNSLK